MTKKTSSNSDVKLRKAPKQRRSTETIDVIVEAAARILETKGFEGFNTNAIAESAGVSIGSLYQYFPSKHALMSALIEREVAPLFEIEKELATVSEFKVALRCFIRACVRNQMRRPELARMVDLTEKRELFNEQVLSTTSRLLAIMYKVLSLPDAPHILKRRSTVADVISIIRTLVDAAGERAEGMSAHLIRSIEGAVMGYLQAG